MFPLHFHYEDVLRQDLLLKLNYANVMEVPGLCEIRVVPKAAPSDFQRKNGKFAMEISCGQKFIQTQRASTGRSFRSNPLLGSNKKEYVNDLARQSTLRGHGMSNYLVRISTVMSLLDFLYVCWLYLFLKVCMYVVQVFARFTKEYFGCFFIFMDNQLILYGDP
jgi:hypothetical protein